MICIYQLVIEKFCSYILFRKIITKRCDRGTFKSDCHREHNKKRSLLNLQQVQEYNLNIMAPKKLTKKQLEEQKKEEQRKKEQEQKKKKEQEERKHAQILRLKQIEEQNHRRQQIMRLQKEKNLYEPKIKAMISRENEEIKKLLEKQNWKRYVLAQQTPAVEGSDLSTFISQYQESKMKTNEELIAVAQNSESLVNLLEQKSMNYLAENLIEERKQAEIKIRQIRKITMKKLEQIMINLANEADSFVEEKLAQIQLSKKQSQIKKHDDKRNDDTIAYKTSDIKIGVFLSSSINKNTLKFKPAEIKQFGMNSEIPGKIMNSNLVIKFQWTKFDPYNSNIYYPYNIVGGVFTVQFFDLVSNSKKIGNWTLKTDYNGRQILDKSRTTQSGQKQSFNVTYQLPQDLYLRSVNLNQIKVAGWDGSKWNILNPQSIDLNVQTKSLKFQTSKSGSFAYIQDRCADYPYLSWELRSVKLNVIHLDLMSKRQKLKFEIGENYAKLIVKDKQSELYKFTKDGVTPQRLLHELAQVGINLLPTDEDYETANIRRKNHQSEQNAIRDISYSLCSFYVRSFKHNEQDIIVKLKQNLEYDEVFLEDQQKDWKKIRWYHNKCSALNRKDTVAHFNLQLLLQSHEIVDGQCLRRINEDHGYLTRKTLIRFLRLTRILSFIIDK